MKAAKLLAMSSGDLLAANQFYHDGGWITLYTFEPPSRVKKHLATVVESLKPFLHEYNNDWCWQVFTRDGYIECFSDGRPIDESDQPCGGGNVFDE